MSTTSHASQFDMVGFAFTFVDLSILPEITTLPIEPGHLNNLEEIYRQATHLTFPPPDIVAQGTPAILAYLRDYEAMLMRKTIAAIATGIGAIAGIILLFRWRRGLSERV